MRSFASSGRGNRVGFIKLRENEAIHNCICISHNINTVAATVHVYYQYELIMTLTWCIQYI